MENQSQKTNILLDEETSAARISHLTNVLIGKTMNEWIEDAKKLPNPKPLFGSIIHEGEVAILFANTGNGKSALAVQIAQSIASGIETLNLHTTKHKVLFCDFELSKKVIQLRYTNKEFNKNSFNFNGNFRRVEIDYNKSLLSNEKSFEELIIDSIKREVLEYQPAVVIIDNITYLSATNEQSKEALVLMKVILELSRKRNIAVLLLAHTPKRDLFRQIQLEDLAGSKALSNFADVVFCIGESVKHSKLRYIKELKNRNYPIVFDENNVLTCELKKEDNALQFEFVEYTSEKEHLEKEQNQKQDNNEEIKKLKDKGYSNVAIGKKLGIDEKTVRRRLKKMDEK